MSIIQFGYLCGRSGMRDVNGRGEAADNSLFSENQVGDAVCLPHAREFMSEHMTQLGPEPGTFELSNSFVLGGGKRGDTTC